jgi:hypothetical protein
MSPFPDRRELYMLRLLEELIASRYTCYRGPLRMGLHWYDPIASGTAS